MPNYSYSRLTTYENCPQQYKLRYIDKLEVPDSGEGIEAFLGRRVHETLEKLHKELILTKRNELQELVDYYGQQWDKNWHDNVLIVKKGFTKEHYRKTGEEALTNYYNRYQPFDQSKTLATEYNVTFKLDGYSIRGVIDRLSQTRDGVYEIHDYKTSGTLPTQEKIERDRQLALYQIGIREKIPDARKVNLVWHYVVFDKEFTSTRGERELGDLKKEISSLIKAVEKDERFSPRESVLCDWCEFPPFCPAKKHATTVESLPVNRYLKDKGVTIVNQYAAIKAEIKDLKSRQALLEEELELVAEAAMRYAAKEGITAMTGSDFLLKIIEKTGLQFPRTNEEGREELEALIRKWGIWEQVSGLNLSKLLKAVEEDAVTKRIKTQLLKFAEEVTQTSVRLVKKIADDD